MFSYPIDSEEILKNRKSLKNRLLNNKTGRIKTKILIISDSAVNDIIDILELFLLDFGIEAKFCVSDFGKYRKEGKFTYSKAEFLKPDIVFIHTSYRSIKSFPALKDDWESICGKLEAEYLKYNELWKRVKELFNCPIIQNNFETPYYRLLGNKEAASIHGRINFINRLNLKFYDYAGNNKNFYINDINYLSAYYGLERWSDPEYWDVYKYSISLQMIPHFAFNLSNIIKSLLGKNKKALVLELGANILTKNGKGRAVSESLGVGEAYPVKFYSELQSYIKSLGEIGVTLALHVKNNCEAAMSRLCFDGGVLNKEDFQIIKIASPSKVQAIDEIAEELNVFPDSIVLLKSNDKAMKILDRSGFFEVTEISEEDLSQNELYRQNRLREEYRKKFADFEEYLDNLEQLAEIDSVKLEDCPILLGLLNRTNQFSLTARRYSSVELENICESDNYIFIAGRLFDKFGDYGIVSAVIGEIIGTTLHIELWIMSRIALDSGFENTMLDELCGQSLKLGLKNICGYYYPSGKNEQIRDMYSRLGFLFSAAKPNGDSVWMLDLELYRNRNTRIRIKKDG